MQIMRLKNIRASSGESISFLLGRYIAIFVTRSTITKIPVELEAVDSGRSEMKSMVTHYQDRDGGDSGMFVQ
jgi:hypothetical protein